MWRYVGYGIPYLSSQDTNVHQVDHELYEIWVASYAKDDTMSALVASGCTFRHNPLALYATDVTFQQTNRPKGNNAEAVPWFSGKHKLYGYKVEVSVNPRGLAINCGSHERGNTADITMFHNNMAFHRTARLKLEDESRIADNGPLQEKCPDEWAVLADKGYQGLGDYLRCIHPQKGSNLIRDEQDINDTISSDRVIVENYFGRLCNLWRICSDK